MVSFSSDTQHAGASSSRSDNILNTHAVPGAGSSNRLEANPVSFTGMAGYEAFQHISGSGQLSKAEEAGLLQYISGRHKDASTDEENSVDIVPLSSAVRVLITSGVATERVCRTLIESRYFESPQQEVRQKGVIGLSFLVNTINERVRQGGEGFSPESRIAILKKLEALLEDRSKAVRKRAIALLPSFGKEAQSSATRLVEIAETREYPAIEALYTLRLIRSPRDAALEGRLVALGAELLDADEEVQRAGGASAIGAVSNRSFVAELPEKKRNALIEKALELAKGVKPYRRLESALSVFRHLSEDMVAYRPVAEFLEQQLSKKERNLLTHHVQAARSLVRLASQGCEDAAERVGRLSAPGASRLSRSLVHTTLLQFAAAQTRKPKRDVLVDLIVRNIENPSHQVEERIDMIESLGSLAPLSQEQSSRLRAVAEDTKSSKVIGALYRYFLAHDKSYLHSDAFSDVLL